MTSGKLAAITTLIVAMAMPASAQFGNLGKTIGKAAELQQNLTFSEEEERQLGSDISTKLRDRYGVVQDKAVHRYVTLVGSVLVSVSAAAVALKRASRLTPHTTK